MTGSEGINLWRVDLIPHSSLDISEVNNEEAIVHV